MEKFKNNRIFRNLSYYQGQSLNLKKIIMASCLDFMTMAAGIICAMLTTLMIGL